MKGLPKMIFMVWYHDIITNNSHTSLKSIIMCHCFEQSKWRGKIKNFFN